MSAVGSDLVAYLSTKGIRTYQGAGDEVTAHCFMGCQDGDPKGKGKLYLNTGSWLYSCKRCDARGGRKALIEHFGDEDDVTWMPGTDPSARRKALGEGVKLAQEMLLNNPAVVEYLTNRGLTPQTILDAGLGYAPTSWGLGSSLTKTNDRRDVTNAGWLTREGQEFFSGAILIPYYDHGHVVQVRGRVYVPGKTVEGAKYITPTGDNARLYGADDLLGARTAIVVEGEFDRLALKQALMRSTDPAVRAIAVVSVAGSQTLPTGFAGYFEHCRRVYIGFDADDAGRMGAARAEQMLGSKARILQLPDALPQCDWTDYLAPKGSGVHAGHAATDVLDLMSRADSVGRLLITPRDAHLQLGRSIDEGGLLLGFSALDMHLGMGIQPGQICIPIARTGAGKSALLATIVYNALPHTQLVVSLELTAAEFWNRLIKIARFWDPNISDEALMMMFDNIRFYEKRIKPGDLPRLCEEFADDVGSDPFAVYVDYIGYAAKAYPGSSQYERVTRCVLDLKEDAKAGRFRLVAPHQAGRGAAGGVRVKSEDARDSGAIEDTADVLMSLYRPIEAQSGQNTFDGEVLAELLKNRNGRKDVTANLIFSMASLVLVQRSDKAASLATLENNLITRGDTYTKVLSHRRKSGAEQLRLVRA
jgi:hypothetical protein